MTCNGRWISKWDPRTGKFKRIYVKNRSRRPPLPNSNFAQILKSQKAKVNYILKKSLETLSNILPLMPGIVGKLGHLVHLANDKLKEAEIRDTLRSIQEQLDALHTSIQKTNISLSTKQKTKSFIKNVRNVFYYSTGDVHYYVNQFFLVGIDSYVDPSERKRIGQSIRSGNHNKYRDAEKEIKEKIGEIAKCLQEQFESEFGKMGEGTTDALVIKKIIEDIVEHCLQKIDSTDSSVQKKYPK
jgi:hypothetical protein